MRAVHNMIAGMTNSVVLVLVNLIALPFYLHYLGMEAYGLIGFYITLQGLAQILDLGLAPTVIREMARRSDDGERRRAASLLRTLGLIYLGTSLLILSGGLMLAPWIGTHWLDAKEMPPGTVIQAVALMAINLACRWPISLYHGALVGAHRLAFSSVISMSANVGAAVCSITVVASGWPTVQAFFIVQACFGALHTLVLRLVASREVGVRGAPYDFKGLRRVWRYSAWMGGITLTSLAFTQLDKAVLSSMLALDVFGNYMVAVLVVSGLQVVITPAFNVIYPKFATLFAQGDLVGLAHHYSLGSRLFASALFALALVLIFHAHALVIVWTGKPDVAQQVAPLVAVLAVGSALNGVMYFPYALQLASGRPRIPFAINLALLLLMVPLIVSFAIRYGAMGGALAWAILGVAYVMVGTWVTGTRVMEFAGWRWLGDDIGIAFAITVGPALLGAWACQLLELGPWSDIAVGCIAALVGASASVLGSAASRQWLTGLLEQQGKLSNDVRR